MHLPAGRPWVIAHRGAPAVFRENTVEALRGAAAIGADAVEFDVRRTADGHPVVHHDATVPGVGPIVSLHAADLRERAPWIPTLDEALAACSGMWVDVEVKNSPGDPDWDPADMLVTAVAERLSAGAWIGRALVSSFSRATLAGARLLAPALPTGWLAGRSVSWEEAVRSTREGEHEFLLPHAATLNGVAGARRIRAAHTAGLLVLPWTVDDAVEAARLAAAGIDGVITNRPDAILSVLGEHRHRHGG